MSKSTCKNSQQKLVLMAGLPGVGKTTIARELAKELGKEWEVIDKDGLIEKLILEKKMDEDSASHEAYDKSFNAVEQSLQMNHSVILDTATLQSFILEKATSIASEMGVQLKILFLVADRDLRNERLQLRPPQITVIRVDPESFTAYFECFSHLPKFPDRFTLDTRKPLDECCFRSIQYLSSSPDDRAELVDDEANLRSEDLVTV